MALSLKELKYQLNKYKELAAKADNEGDRVRFNGLAGKFKAKIQAERRKSKEPKSTSLRSARTFKEPASDGLLTTPTAKSLLNPPIPDISKDDPDYKLKRNLNEMLEVAFPQGWDEAFEMHLQLDLIKKMYPQWAETAEKLITKLDEDREMSFLDLLERWYLKRRGLYMKIKSGEMTRVIREIWQSEPKPKPKVSEIRQKVEAEYLLKFEQYFAKGFVRTMTKYDIVTEKNPDIDILAALGNKTLKPLSWYSDTETQDGKRVEGINSLIKYSVKLKSPFANKQEYRRLSSEIKKTRESIKAASGEERHHLVLKLSDLEEERRNFSSKINPLAFETTHRHKAFALSRGQLEQLSALSLEELENRVREHKLKNYKPNKRNKSGRVTCKKEAKALYDLIRELIKEMDLLEHPRAG